METVAFWDAVDILEEELIEKHKERIRLYREKNDTNFLEGQVVPGTRDTALFFEPRASFDVKGRVPNGKRGGRQFVFWLMSKDNYKPWSVAGHVTEAHARLAAQGIINNTHRLATAAEIAHYLQEREAHAEYIRAMDANRTKKESAGIDRLADTVKGLMEKNDNGDSQTNTILAELVKLVGMLAAKQTAPPAPPAPPAQPEKSPVKPPITVKATSNE